MIKFLNKTPESIDISDKKYNRLPTKLPKKAITFDCSNNRLTSLVGSPLMVKINFIASHNKLVDLAGGPVKVGGSYFVDNNQLTSLFGAPKLLKKDLYLRYNFDLLDVSDIWDSNIGGTIYFDLIQGMAILPLIKFDSYDGNNIDIDNIHDKYHGSSKQNILDFQYELIENGFADSAKWKP